MKNKLILLILCLCSVSIEAQQTFIGKYNLPVYDNSWKNYNKFWTNDVIIVIPNNIDQVADDAKAILESNKERNVKITIKSESQLKKEDFKRNLFILGQIQSYSHWDKFGTPIQKLKNGFKISNYSLTDPSYGLSYVCDSLSIPMRIAFIGNSMESYKQVQNQGSVGFNYLVKKDGAPAYIGNTGSIVDLSAFKEKHYNKTKESKYYIFMLSEDLDDEQLAMADEKIVMYDKYAESFIEKLKLDMPKDKIKTYINADQQELKYICGAYWSLDNDNTLYGNTPGGEIHSWGFSDYALGHEAGHYLINNQIHWRTVTFISEGLQMWYVFIGNDAVKQQAMQLAKESVSEDLTGLISGKIGFSGEKDYFISGIFVGYLIDTYGIDKFKELYAFDFYEAPAGFEKTYNKSLSLVLEDYKNWLMK